MLNMVQIWYSRIANTLSFTHKGLLGKMFAIRE